ncbi:MAG: GNAT family N-acetyltransferase [Candidatus Pacebacteria bacterium]|nr:GNAT family N-acetyltransferase [Candidatus Paceibacterota bacterium]
MENGLLILEIDEYLSLRVRPLSEAEGLSTLIEENRQHLREWLPWLDDSTSIKDSEIYLQRVLDGIKVGDCCDFGIYYNDAQIGSAGFHSLDAKNRNGEIGYWISKNFEGKGIITKVVKTLIDYGRDKCNLHRIVIKVQPDNKRSWSIPVRLGFELEGVERDGGIQNGVFIDLEVWSLLV